MDWSMFSNHGLPPPTSREKEVIFAGQRYLKTMLLQHASEIKTGL